MTKAMEPAKPMMPTLLEVPEGAKPKPDLIWDENTTVDDLAPPRFFGLEAMQESFRLRSKASGERVESMVLTIAGISQEYLCDPDRPKEGDWKVCLSFEETPTMLVLNKTRLQQMSQITGSPFPMSWVTYGKISLRPGLFNGKGQIGIEAFDEVTF